MNCPFTSGAKCWRCPDHQYRKCLTLGHKNSTIHQKMHYDSLHGALDRNFKKDAVIRDWDWIYSKEHYTEDGKIKEA